ncbi:hypothetical protein [Herbidospora mongoliensis]|uniref:hypothetical protein n=1 Tax=Herbidospora mongoliensis TaxID=688067 RepID=UPI00082F81C6|nr:hypothetical protein [Herbidospora mongoliensis]
MKVAAREHARHRGVPVLMDCNDRGMLDVERFDQEPDRSLLHGRIGEIRSTDLREFNRDELVEFLLLMVDESQVSAPLRDAIGRLGKDLSSWPQLASGTMLGGALVTDTARRILTGREIRSGRYYTDLERLVG